MKLYFQGGEDIKKRDSKEINEKAFANAVKSPTVLIFPWTEVIEKIEYRTLMYGYFRELGGGKIDFAELSDSFQRLKEKIESSDIIYLPGGKTQILIGRIKERKISRLLQRYNKVMIGNSAGSLAMCKRYAVIKGQEGEPRTTTEEGIGKVDFEVTVHYKSAVPELSGQSPDRELRTLSRKMNTKIYAIPERSALVYDDKKIEPIGDISVFDKGKKTKL
ncbi:MAG TPA: Type 1 glutamine amidotransferase-like domain-containing protein [Verrucomicrobiae bacterium]|nr:Type 1 glutamine amidotransferase-like domain-containing protein [Verrucomicrobiae bacterium]